MLDARTIRSVAFVALISSVPIALLVWGFDRDSGFLGFLQVGSDFESRALPELRAARPPMDSPYGYDGQFYAQVALDPTLGRPDLPHALDNSAYRSTRIGLPLLAHVLGLGQPSAALQIYALLNFGFWILLLVMFLKYVGIDRPRDMLLAAALLWTTGTLVSLGRALTDFPAVAVGVTALWLGSNRTASAGLLSAACLIKDTSVLQILAIGWPERLDRSALRLVVTWGLMLVPLAAWSLYVRSVLPNSSIPLASNFDLPFSAIAQKMLTETINVGQMIREGRFSRIATFELLAPASLLVQAAYLVRYPRFESSAWRYGVAVVPLMLVISDAVWEEQIAFSRALLPLTASFNLLVHAHEEGRSYVCWYIAGNAGMLWIFVKVLGI